MKSKLFSSRLFATSIIALALILQSFVGLFAQNNSPLCFTAKSAGATVSFNLRTEFSETIQTSRTNNGTDWTDYTSGASIKLTNIGEKIFFRAANQHTQSFCAYRDGYSNFVFSGSIDASGNIMSLYGPNCPDIALPDSAFMFLFSGCTSLQTAPELPATSLGDCCYMYMFYTCTSLKTAPELSSIALKKGCYYAMFSGCSSLEINTVQPGKKWIIPANADTTGATYWNLAMFNVTGGTFTGNPEIGVTYYVASDTTTTTDVENVIDEPNITIYPNPIHIGETVYMNADEDLSMIEIYNVDGECVRRIQNPDRVIEITGLNANGVYIIKMINANGLVTSQKLIVD